MTDIKNYGIIHSWFLVSNYTTMNPEVKNSINSEINKVQDLCWFELIKEFWDDMDKYPMRIHEMKSQNTISLEDFTKKFNINQKRFTNLKEENIWPNPIEEMRKTYSFLKEKFETSKKDLESIGVDYDEFIKAIIKRLEEQLIEAGSSERKLKNGTVIWLSKFSEEWFDFIRVPYFAFASTCVSLDLVKVKNKDWEELTLREIDTLLGSKNSAWEFFLPNSLWVSVCMSSSDKNWNPVFISQERNNATTLTQNQNKYIASASWWVPAKLLENWDNLNTAINKEIEEELWLNSVNLRQKEVSEKARNILNKDPHNIIMWVKSVLSSALKDRITNEISNVKNSWTIPMALVMEEARRNPEIVFISNVDSTLEEIQESWKNAEDKNESLSIKWITLDEIEKDLKLRENRKQPIIDDHFYMSYFGFLLKWKDIQKLEDYQ